MKVIYKGDHASVIVPVNATQSISATWGEPVDVPDELAENLLTSEAWMKAGKEAKKATAQAADSAEDNATEKETN